MGKLVRFRREKKVRRATDARPSLFAYDASTSLDTPKDGKGPDPEIERRNVRRQRSAIVAFVIVFLGGTAAALFGDRGYLDVERKRQQHRELAETHAARLERVEALRREVDRLRTDPTAVERIAREELGYVAPGEITLLLPGDDPAKPRRLDAKKASGIVSGVSKAP
jgi:cell division protein FtsB